MSRLNSSLCNIVRNEEKVKFAIDNLRLFNEALIHVSSRRGIQYLRSSLFEESLSDSFVHDNKGDLRSSLVVFSLKPIFISNYLFELFKFIINDLFPHWVADSISVDEDVIRQLAFVKISISSESAWKILLENVWRNNLLSFLSLRACLSVILAKMRVICGDESYDWLLSFVANINAN